LKWWIGNDVVDLAEPGVAGKERDRRFMDRVFTPEERAHILEAAAPTIALWKTWAAKETAFKIASKLREGVVFAHRAFEVEVEATGQRARVRFEGLDVRVRWELAREYVHCIGQLARERSSPCLLRGAKAEAQCAAVAESLLDWRRFFSGIVHEGQALQGQLTEAEQASVHSTASARARLLARRLMERWDPQGAEIVRLWRSWGWGPPVVAREGTPLPAFDVSLSHDGRFVAAAVVGPGI
jgi:phosphopantetheine--protein transferase-like protein